MHITITKENGKVVLDTDCESILASVCRGCTNDETPSESVIFESHGATPAAAVIAAAIDSIDKILEENWELKKLVKQALDLRGE